MSKTYEIRCPIHGFIELDEWEMEMVNHSAFQRLRRIRQLGLSELVYPGTTHTRFEHSLGVMHVGTRMFDQIVKKRKDFLEQELGYNDVGLGRYRKIVRLACLLHDIGHSPFSHAGEEIMPKKNENSNDRYKHEDYSVGIIRYILNEVLENSNLCSNWGITADHVADMLEREVERHLNQEREVSKHVRLWHNIVSSQLDADRADYLLRDSYYAGVAYGHYDLDRIIASITVCYGFDGNTPIFAIEDGGVHAAEALIIARYMMFLQVYWHKTRMVCDYHVTEALKHLLKNHYPDGIFPPPTSKENLEKYLEWDDYRVFGEMHYRECGRHKDCIFNRKLDKCVFDASEKLSMEKLKLFKHIKEYFDKKKVSLFYGSPETNWYKDGEDEILIWDGSKTAPLSEYSQVVRNLKAAGIHRIYAPMDDYDEKIRQIYDLEKIFF